MTEYRTLYEVVQENSTIKDGVRRFPASGNQYRQRLALLVGNVRMIPIIDGIYRVDLEMVGKPSDVYAALLKREGLISG